MPQPPTPPRSPRSLQAFSLDEEEMRRPPVPYELGDEELPARPAPATPFAEAFRRASIPPPAPLRSTMAADSKIVALKELTQVANRRSFHLEKLAFVFASSAIFLIASFVATDGWRADLRAASTFGRESFQPVSMFACAVLSLSALISASGIVMSEAVGKRLDLLRITPLSLGSVVIGKAASVFAKAGLVTVMLLPVLAAAQLLGGVAKADLVVYLFLTLADVFLVTTMGVYISAGAKSNIDRVVRSAEGVVLWLLLTSIIDIPFITMRTRISISPLYVWGLYLTSRWSATGIFINVAFHVGAGILLLKAAIRSLAVSAVVREGRSARPGDESLLTAEDPNVEHLLSGLLRGRKKGKKVRTVSAERKWAGTLIGSQLLHTSLVAVLLPMAVGVPQVIIFILSTITGRGQYDWRETYPAFVSTTLGSAMAFMLLVQSCSLLTLEKTRHTAELLAITPEGGPSMLWWKGAATGLSQIVSFCLCIAMLLAGGIIGRAPFEMSLLGVMAYVILVVLVFCAGVAFSLACKSSYEAFALLGASVVFVAPCLYYALSNVLGSVGRIGGMRVLRARHAGPEFATVFLVVLIPALALVGFRNLFPRVARFILVAGLGLFLAGTALSLSTSVSGNGSGFLLPLMPIMGILDYGRASMLWSALACMAAQLALAGVLLAGCWINFTPVFLFGAKPKD